MTNLTVTGTDGEIYELASAVTILRRSPEVILLAWKDAQGENRQIPLPRREPEPVGHSCLSGSLFDHPAEPRPLAPAAATAKKESFAEMTRTDEELVRAFKKLVLESSAVTLRQGKAPSKAEMKTASTIRKRYKGHWRTLLLRSAVKAEFSTGEQKRLLTILPPGVIKDGRGSDTKTRDIVVHGRTYSCYAISRRQLRQI